MREVIRDAEARLKLHGQSTFLLLDECHRWSKAQSDSILPAIEQGVIRFIGSTTENPSVAMTPAIVSRCRLFHFDKLAQAEVERAILRAIADKEDGYGLQEISIDEAALHHIAHVANGDVRAALNALELAVLTTPKDRNGATAITLEVAEQSIQQPVLQMDESMFYDMLSAFCKSLRGSDSDAALAWFARLIQAGVDPRIVVRRIIAHASEDVGLANPMAMLQAVAAAQALEFIGMPEAKLPIAQAIIAVSESPKSNAVVLAVERALGDAARGGYQPVWWILDSRHPVPPSFMQPTPNEAEFREAGLWVSADTAEELAERIGVPADALVATLERYDADAAAGEDTEFHRAEDPYDLFFVRFERARALHPLDQPPFYALQIVLGDLGTKGGLRIDDQARVVRADGTPIEGLYAAGNTAANVTGAIYPGPGAPIGTGMVWGYRAARHLAGVTVPA